jgi:MFS family permease
VPNRNRALILLLAINLFNYIDRQILAAVLPNIQADLHVTKEQLGGGATAFLVSYMILSPIFGYLADRGGRWLLIGIGVALWSIASGATGLATSLGALLITRCFVGVGEAAYGPSAPTLLSDLYPVEKRGQVLSWFYLAIPIGSALGYVLGGALSAWWGWRAAFFALTPPGLVLAVIAMRMTEPPRGAADHIQPKSTANWRDYLALAKNPSYVLDTLGLTAMTFALGGVGFWMPTYIDELGTAGGLEKINLIFGIIVVISGLLGTLAGGWLGDKLRTKFPGAYFLVCGISMILGAPAFLLMLETPFPSAWALVFLGCFLLFMNTGPGNAILANVTSPSIRGTAFALNILIVHALGDAISPLLIGHIATTHSLRTGFAFMSAMMVIGGIFWLLGAKYLEKDTASAARAA